MELVGVHIPNDGCGIGPQLHSKTIRITVVNAATAFFINPVFVHASRFDTVHITLPEVSIIDPIHIVFPPLAAFSNQRNLLRSRSKGAEYYAGVRYMSAEILIGIKNFTSIKSMKIHVLLLSEQRPPFRI